MFQRRGIWCVRFYENGRRRILSLGTRDFNNARIRADVILAECGARKARARLAKASGADVHAWAMDRWHRMNHRERQAAVFAAHKGRCVYCSREVHIPLARDQKSPDRAVLDHRVPVSGGGSNGFENTVLACNACNAKKYDGEMP